MLYPLKFAPDICEGNLERIFYHFVVPLYPVFSHAQNLGIVVQLKQPHIKSVIEQEIYRQELCKACIIRKGPLSTPDCVDQFRLYARVQFSLQPALRHPTLLLQQLLDTIQIPIYE